MADAPSLFNQVAAPRARDASKQPSTTPVSPLRPDGQFACIICGAPACFGFDVKLTQGRLGVWACPDHRETVKSRRPRDHDQEQSP